MIYQKECLPEIHLNFATKFTDLNLFTQLTRAKCRLFMVLSQAMLKFKA